MRVAASFLYGFLACAAVALLLGVLLVRRSRLRTLRGMGWLLFAAGVGGVALLALLQFAGRLGLEHLWFRSPAFYAATGLVIAATAWWWRQPTPRRVRLGIPATLVALAALGGLAVRLDGHSTPLAMLMPRMRCLLR